jgi:hypothetical protein
VNADCLWIVRISANEGAIIAALEREPWESSRDVGREPGLSQSKVPEIFHDDQLHPYRLLAECTSVSRR